MNYGRSAAHAVNTNEGPDANTSAIEEILAETEARRWEALKERADTAFDSGYLPNHVKSKVAARAIAMAGEELGIPPMTAYRVIYFFDGKIALAASLMQALAYKRVKGFRIDYVKTTEAGCWVMAFRPGMTEPAKISFTIEDAQRAGLTGKDNWRKYPAAMCRARAVAAAVRAVAPEAVLGVLATEEAEDGVPYDDVMTPEGKLGAGVATGNDALKDKLRGQENGNGHANGNGQARPKPDRAAPPPGFTDDASAVPAGFSQPKPEAKETKGNGNGNGKKAKEAEPAPPAASTPTDQSDEPAPREPGQEG